MYEKVMEYFDLINDQFSQAKEKHLSRFSIEWGKWSREFNLELRERIEKEDEWLEYYQYLYLYWLNRSQMLELYFKSSTLTPETFSEAKRNLVREGNYLRKTLLTKEGFVRMKVTPMLKEILKDVQSDA